MGEQYIWKHDDNNIRIDLTKVILKTTNIQYFWEINFLHFLQQNKIFLLHLWIRNGETILVFVILHPGKLFPERFPSWSSALGREIILAWYPSMLFLDEYF